jgi:hypothetical protein
MSYTLQHPPGLSHVMCAPREDDVIPANVGAVPSAAPPVVNDENAAGAPVSAQAVPGPLHGTVR